MTTQERTKEIAAELRCAVEKIVWATKALNAEGYTVQLNCVTGDGYTDQLYPMDKMRDVESVKIFKTLTENL